MNRFHMEDMEMNCYGSSSTIKDNSNIPVLMNESTATVNLALFRVFNTTDLTC
jgi:hypothetical protein